MFVEVFFLNDCPKSKSNPIYFKEIKIIQNVMSLLTLKNQMQKCNICDYNFLGGVVCFHPQCYEIKQVMCQYNKMFIEVLNKF